MANFVYNVAKGRVHEFARRVLDNDPTNAAFVVVAIDTSTADSTLIDLNDLAAVLADAGTAEVTNTNYARFVIDDSGEGLTVTIDDTNDRVDIDFSDITFSAIAAGDSWTDLIVCFDSDTTGGTDSNIIPVTQHDFAVTPDGSDIVAQVDSAGFYRAS